jgi:DNA-binding beta-propeller fold protein YncE
MNELMVYAMWDAEAGVWVATYCSFGLGFGYLNIPAGISYSGTNWYVTEIGLGRVQVFDTAWNSVRAFGTVGSENGQFNTPYGVQVANDTVYVVDKYNYRVQIFDVVTGTGTPGRENLPEIVMSRDPMSRDVWISDGFEAWILSPEGKLAGPVNVTPTSLFRDDAEGLVGVAQELPGAGTVEVITSPVDLSTGDSKHAVEIQGQYEGVSDAAAGILWRASDGASHRAGTMVPCNTDKVAWPQQSFVSGKLRVTATDTDANVVLSNFTMRYQTEGVNYVRGMRGVPEGRQ